ncbi:MAG: hypothetical protein AAF213_11880, partial [Pseudomonadota bacterium]
MTPSQLLLALSFAAAGLAFYPTTMVVICGMLPTLVAYFTDDSESKLGGITVGALNASGTLMVVMNLFIKDHSYQHALALISDPFNWLIMYSTAAFGWAIWLGVPKFYAYLSVVAAEKRLKVLRQTRADLIKEWGAELNRIEVERREAREAEAQARAEREQ